VTLNFSVVYQPSTHQAIPAMSYSESWDVSSQFVRRTSPVSLQCKLLSG